MVTYPSSGMRTLPAAKARPLSVLSRALAPTLLALAGVGLSLGLAGCAKVKIPFMAPSPTVLELKAVAAKQVNPDARKRPSPVMVRVYELKARTQFDAADFISLFERDKDLLGSELVARDEFVLRPGETKDIQRTAQPDTKFVAVLVGFRDLEKARSRAVAAVVPNTTNNWVIQIEPLSVAILPAPKP